MATQCGSISRILLTATTAKVIPPKAAKSFLQQRFFLRRSERQDDEEHLHGENSTVDPSIVGACVAKER